MTEDQFKRGFLLRAGMLSLALLAVVFVYVAKALPVRFLGLALILVIIPFTVVFWSFIRTYSAEQRAEVQALGAGLDQATRKRYRSSIKTFRITAAAFALLLVYGSLATSGERLWPRLIGVGLNVFIIFSCLATAKRLQRKLRAAESGSTET